MSSRAYHVVVCDHEGCDEEGPFEPSAAIARSSAYYAGFQMVRVWPDGHARDFCEFHIEAARERRDQMMRDAL